MAPPLELQTVVPEVSHALGEGWRQPPTRTNGEPLADNDREKKKVNSSSGSETPINCILRAARHLWRRRDRRRDLLLFARAPVRRKQATRDLALKIISYPAAPRSDVFAMSPSVCLRRDSYIASTRTGLAI